MFGKLLRKKTAADLPSYEERLAAAKERPMPVHIAIIMDGNGRWAKQRKLPRIAGHHEGMKTVRKTTLFASRLGVEVLTLYAFSTENWKRPKREIDFLMKLPGEFLSTYLPELVENNVKVEMIGSADLLPVHTKEAIERAMQETSSNDGMVLNFAMNYGSRFEISEAVKKIAVQLQQDELALSEITEETVSKAMMTCHLPDPDLLIRTSGEVRLSNFMLWQLAYAELAFTEVLWPDFDEHTMLTIIEDYQKRSRRFGSLEGNELT
ncbi:isoprenyl transferase [Sporosarcina sp. NCCP-2716]|uniref:isoprenyl transferase n=1 Tax=Sporosarcina sp. NCCP-2716 TaxID=2943679 RepID=UPI002042446C|nr:isoprenyl transferase [Sporosarcina sp. NCCP-2716]GKV67830.1 isoprenyl transferase [Sporosarcina sp. NCCP-2716]